MLKSVNRYEFTATISYCALQFSGALVYGCIPPVVNRLADQTGASLSMIAAALSIRYLIYVITTLFLGKLFDRFAGNKILALNCLLLVFFAFLFPRVEFFPLLVIALILSGFLSAIMDIGCNTGILWTLKDRAGQAMNLMFACCSLGLMIAPMLVGYSIRKYDRFSEIVLIFGLISIPFGLMIVRLKNPTKNNRMSVKSVPDVNPSLKRTIFNPILLSAAIFLFFEVGSECGFSNWGPSLVFRSGISDEAAAASISTAFGAGSFFGRLINIYLIRKIKAEKILIGAVMLTFISSLCIPIIPNLMIFLITAFLIGFGTAPVYATILVFVENKLPLTGLSTGFLLGMLGSGAMVIPLIAGTAFDRAGIGAYTIFLSGFLLLSLFFLLRMKKI